MYISAQNWILSLTWRFFGPVILFDAGGARAYARARRRFRVGVRGDLFRGSDGPAGAFRGRCGWVFFAPVRFERARAGVAYAYARWKRSKHLKTCSRRFRAIQRKQHRVACRSCRGHHKSRCIAWQWQCVETTSHMTIGAARVCPPCIKLRAVAAQVF